MAMTNKQEAAYHKFWQQLTDVHNQTTKLWLLRNMYNHHRTLTIILHMHLETRLILVQNKSGQ